MGYGKDEMEWVYSGFKEIIYQLIESSILPVMKYIKELYIFYIYLVKEIIYLIKTGQLHNILDSRDNASSKGSGRQELLKLALRALLLSFLVFFTMVYIHQGSLIFNEDGSTIFNSLALFEFSATVIFLFLIFIVHRGISQLINNSRLGHFSLLTRGILEAILVIISTLILLYFSLALPFRLVFPEVDIPEDRIRFNNVVMAIIILFFYYYVERERSKKQLQKEMLRTARLQKENFEAQLQNLKNQVNPHFLFNSLNVLGSLIPANPERATEFTTKLSEVYRAFLHNSDKELIPLEEELEIAQAYIYLIKTRFGDAIAFKTKIKEELKEMLLPPGALQALLENAVKHNGSTRKDPLIVHITTEGNRLVVSNKLRPRKAEATGTGTGLENIKNRYKYLSDQLPVFEKTETEYIVQLPLLRIEKV